MGKLDHEKLNESRTLKVKAEMGMNDHTKTKLAELMGLSLSGVIAKLSCKNPWTVKDLEILSEIYGKDRKYFF